MSGSESAVAVSFPVAELERRFYALALDRLIGWGLCAALGALSWLLLGHDDLWRLVAVLAGVVLVVSLVLAVLVGVAGTSPGKAIVGLRVVHVGTGTPIGVGRALLRALVLGLATLPTAGIGLATLAWTAVEDRGRRRRGWHDHLARSVVVDVRPVPEEVEEVDEGPRHIVNLTALRLVPAPPPGDEPAPPVGVVGATPTRTAPSRRGGRPSAPGPAPVGAPVPAPSPMPAPMPAPTWTPPPQPAPQPGPSAPPAPTGPPTAPPPGGPGVPPGQPWSPPLAAPPPAGPPPDGPRHFGWGQGATVPGPNGPPPPVDEDGRTVIRGSRPAPARWRVSFDTGDAFLVEGLVLVGRRPEPRSGEPVRHLVPLPSADMSVSKTHAQVATSPDDGALVVTDRGSTNGSHLVRRGVTRELPPGKPTTLLPGDKVLFGDRTMTVSRED